MAGVTKLEPQFIELAAQGVQFDVRAFDALIRDHGVRLVHWRGMPCPVGLVERDDGRRPHPDHEGCSNGMLYTRAGGLTCVLQGNRVERRETTVGQLDSSAAQLTAPRFYDAQEGDGDPVYLQPGDKFYLPDEGILVARGETVTATTAGVDRLAFPAVTVQDLVDDRGQRYRQGSDFDLASGRIAWKDGRAPVQVGAIYAVRYLYRPYFVVQELLHDVRVGQAAAPGGLQAVRLPQSCLVRREYALLGSSQQDPDARVPADPRQAAAAPSGGA